MNEQEQGECLARLARIIQASARPSIYREIELERARQDAQWGGPEHDDTHEWGDWERYIENQVRSARCGRPDFRGPDDLLRGQWKKRMVKIAALAVAAIEVHMRKEASDAAPEEAKA